MRRPKIQQGVIVDGPNRHPMTPDLYDQRGTHTVETDPLKKSRFVVERDDITEREEEDVPNPVLQPGR